MKRLCKLEIDNLTIRVGYPLGALRERIAYMHFDNRGKSVRESHC